MNSGEVSKMTNTKTDKCWQFIPDKVANAAWTIDKTWNEI